MRNISFCALLRGLHRLGRELGDVGDEGRLAPE